MKKELLECLVVSLLMVAGGSLGWSINQSIINQQLIERNIKQYNTQTGGLEWCEGFKEGQ